MLLRIADAVDAPLWKLLTDDRLTPDEKAWDAAARELGERVHGLAQPDLQALTYLATRLTAAESMAKAARPAPLGGRPRSVSAVTASRAAESGQQWPPMSRRSRTKRSR